jgi:hypothetical protein
MPDLQTLETADLIDLLASHTAEYTRMLADGLTDDRFTNCQAAILLLQFEIRSRSTNTAGDRGIQFTQNIS